MNFTNLQIQTDTLPKIENVVLKPISKHYLKIIILNKLAFYALIFGALFTLKHLIEEDGFQDNFWTVFLVVLGVCLLNFLVVILAFKKRKYAIREKDIIYAKGLILHSMTTVPISRIQHVEESRSWLARQLKLATLKIYTAGESGSDLSIKGLPHHEAQQINDFINAKVNANN